MGRSARPCAAEIAKMWGERAKTRVARAIAEVFSDLADTRRLGRWASKLQHGRVLVDEAASAFWHLAAMPSRQDVRALQRRVSTLRRRVRELEEVLDRLERAEGRGATRDDARP